MKVLRVVIVGVGVRNTIHITKDRVAPYDHLDLVERVTRLALGKDDRALRVRRPESAVEHDVLFHGDVVSVVDPDAGVARVVHHIAHNPHVEARRVEQPVSQGLVVRDLTGGPLHLQAGDLEVAHPLRHHAGRAIEQYPWRVARQRAQHHAVDIRDGHRSTVVEPPKAVVVVRVRPVGDEDAGARCCDADRQLNRRERGGQARAVVRV
eukprot:876410-Prymnesium_polylepis.1